MKVQLGGLMMDCMRYGMGEQQNQARRADDRDELVVYPLNMLFSRYEIVLLAMGVTLVS